MFVTGLVLAAGGSTRLTMARSCGFDQLIVALGGSADDIVGAVDLSGAEVVRNDAYTTGCSSSIAAALDAVDPAADGIVLLLGDKLAVDPATVQGLVSASLGEQLGVCRYRDGLGHPLWLGRAIFPELAGLHGDKAVWRLLDADRSDPVEWQVNRPIPRDVDTWDDYQALVADSEGRT